MKIGTAEVHGMMKDKDGSLVVAHASKKNQALTAALAFSVANNLMIPSKATNLSSQKIFNSTLK